MLESGDIDALGHIEGEYTVTLEPDCTEKGAWEIRCTVCNEVLESGDIEALGHIPGERTITDDPTCTSKGAWEIRCTVCDAVIESGDIEALGHLPGDRIVTLDPTCTESGAWEIRCAVCDEVLESGDINPLGHIAGEAVVVLQPTYDNEGVWEIRCTVCEELLDTGVIARLYSSRGEDQTGGPGGSSNISYISAADDVSIMDDETPLAFLLDHIQYVNGYPDGRFAPDMGITRAEAAAIFHRLLANEDKDVPATVSFNDMNGGEWYYQAVAYLANAGITTGYPDGSFRPEAPITRAEYATMASRFDNLVETEESRFNDVTGDHWAAKYINSAAAKGWVNGYDDGTFQPENPVTRAQVVTIVNNMLERNIKLVNIPEDAPSYNDVTTSHWAYCAIIEASSTHAFERLEDNSETWLQ